ncbi:MAG: ABC transporter permease [Cyclobacteriaceae bacterium]|nr:MAG: ABC transporter permease [Cyclobacteriaceae bacterium]
MLRNYILVALRNIRKQKFFAFINIAGLAIGISVCLLVYLYVTDELSYDRFHRGYGNIYRIGLHGRLAGQEIYTSNSSLPVGPAAVSDIPGVEEMVRLFPIGGSTGVAFRYEDHVFSEPRVFGADSNFFSFFSFELLRGDARTALKEVNSVVITEALARKYFGSDDPIGKIITIGNDKWPCKVTGVTRGAPANSHIQFNAIISFATIEKTYWPGWTGNSIYTYLRKNPQTSVEQINAGLAELVRKHVGKELEEGLGINFDEFLKQGGIYSYMVYPMADSHLYSQFRDDMEPSGDISHVYIFSAIGLFVLLIACINFMNLSTARSVGRAKEVGLRKTFGSVRSQMIFRFLAESVVYSLLAMMLALIATYLVLPWFNELAGKSLTFWHLLRFSFLGISLVLALLVGIIAGSYPAFYLTSFEAVNVLKGKLQAGAKSKGIRSALVVLQFAVSAFLIVATLVVYRQLEYMQDKDLGMDQHQVIQVRNTRRLGGNQKAFRQEAEKITGVELASFTSNVLPGVNNTTVFRVRGVNQDFLAGKYYADYNHVQLMKLKMKAGRFFSPEFATDSSAVVLNEAAVKEFGLENPLEAYIIDFNDEVPDTLRVVGVVSDFNFESLKTHVRPLVIRLADVSHNLLVRYSGNPQTVVSGLEELWRRLGEGEPFSYTFMDQDFDELFRAELRMRNIFLVLAGITLFIACMGLFALASFTTEQRTKEIGIRKVLGAPVYTLALLLTREFTVLVGVALVPALLMGWYFGRQWLQNFTYRTAIGAEVYLVASLLALVIAWVTVSYQALKAARANPAHSLRYE